VCHQYLLTLWILSLSKPKRQNNDKTIECIYSCRLEANQELFELVAYKRRTSHFVEHTFLRPPSLTAKKRHPKRQITLFFMIYHYQTTIEANCLRLLWACLVKEVLFAFEMSSAAPCWSGRAQDFCHWHAWTIWPKISRRQRHWCWMLSWPLLCEVSTRIACPTNLHVGKIR